MSQVVVIKDKHESAREKSLVEEKKIILNSHTKEWLKTYSASPSLLEKVFNKVIYPGLGALWALPLATIVFVVGLVTGFLKLLGTVFASLITGLRPKSRK